METDPIIVDFPLRGEWVAYHTPAERVPSHGTNQLGQRYAFDFLRIERDTKDWKFYNGLKSRHFLMGISLKDCPGWGKPIHAPFDGIVTVSRDGVSERNPVHFIRDLAVVLKNALLFDPAKTERLALVLGNHIILKMPHAEVYMFVAHARTNSIRVRKGDSVQRGIHLADVGHSGNSTAPHLHFHLMDGPDVRTAHGLPCCFKEYDALQGHVWVKVNNGVPGKREFIRYESE